MPAAVIEMAAVRVVRDGATLLDDVGWVVGPGQRWVVLGPNGAGKTTLLQVAGGWLRPTAGTVDLLDERVGRTDLAELRTRIGMSSAALAERVPAGESVLDVVVTAARSVVGRGLERYERGDLVRGLGLLARWGCAGLTDRRYGTLSEGERKRVLVARALMTDPELLLLDEPAAGLDLGGREDLVRRLAVLAADPHGPATVLVTHHVEEIPAGMTHALLLRGGRVVAAGPLPSTLTAAALGATFGLELSVSERAGRWSARATDRPGA